MPYEIEIDKRGNRRFYRTRDRVIASPKGKVTIEPAKPATVAKVDSGLADVTTTSVPTTPTAKKSK
jgi:hypothetical protein